MKITRAVFCSVSLWASVASAQDLRMGTLKSVAGEVSLAQAASRRPAVIGGGLQPKERILTGRGASATFMLKDGTVVSV